MRATLFACLLACVSAQAADYYVDAEHGRDGNPGTSPEQAWQTLERVNAARLNPGDRVRFTLRVGPVDPAEYHGEAAR